MERSSRVQHEHMNLWFKKIRKFERAEIIQVGLNMHLYDDIGDASSSLRGSTSSWIMGKSWILLFKELNLEKSAIMEVSFCNGSEDVANYIAGGITKKFQMKTICQLGSILMTSNNEQSSYV